MNQLPLRIHVTSVKKCGAAALHTAAVKLLAAAAPALPVTTLYANMS